MTSPRINRSSNLEDRILIRNNYNYYSRSPYLERRKQENYVITNEKIDYKTLFEREKQEREVRSIHNFFRCDNDAFHISFHSHNVGHKLLKLKLTMFKNLAKM